MGRIASTGMVTDVQVPRAEDKALPAASLLQLIWLASPALPVGGFSYSEGLEAVILRAQAAPETIATGAHNNSPNEWLTSWLCDQLQLTLARGDLAVLARAIAAWRCGDLTRITHLNDWLLNTRETNELRAQAEQMEIGRAHV